MNSYPLVHKLIETTFATAWAAGAASSVPVEYENAGQNIAGSEYVRLSVTWGGAEPRAISPRENREFGVIFLQIFTPPGQGARRALDIAEVAKPIFDDQVLSDSGDDVTIYCDPTGVQGVGDREGYFQINLTTPFEFRRRPAI